MFFRKNKKKESGTEEYIHKKEYEKWENLEAETAEAIRRRRTENSLIPDFIRKQIKVMRILSICCIVTTFPLCIYSYIYGLIYIGIVSAVSFIIFQKNIRYFLVCVCSAILCLIGVCSWRTCNYLGEKVNRKIFGNYTSEIVEKNNMEVNESGRE